MVSWQVGRKNQEANLSFLLGLKVGNKGEGASMYLSPKPLVVSRLLLSRDCCCHHGFHSSSFVWEVERMNWEHRDPKPYTLSPNL